MYDNIDFGPEGQKIIAKLATTSDEVLRKELIKKIIDRATSYISTGEKVVGVKRFNALDVKFYIMPDTEIEYPVAEGATASTEGTGEPIEFTMTLRKAEKKLEITYEAKSRDMDKITWENQLKKAAKKFLITKDQNIFSKLVAGAGHTIAAGTAWNDSSATPDSDIADALEWLIENAPGVTDLELKNIAVVVPAKIMPHLMKLTDINNLRTSVKEWIESSWQLQFYPTTYSGLSDKAMVLFKGEETAVHGVYAGKDIPLVEKFKEPGKDIYIVRQYFNTKVIPDSASSEKSSRIVLISGVA